MTSTVALAKTLKELCGPSPACMMYFLTAFRAPGGSLFWIWVVEIVCPCANEKLCTEASINLSCGQLSVRSYTSQKKYFPCGS